MAKHLYTQAEVTALCVTVGFTASQAKIAGAIAMAETPSVINGVQYCDFNKVGDQALADDTWGYSYGAFQIRSLRAQKGTGGFRDELRLPEPTFNTQSALKIYKASGFEAWSTYNSGAFKGFLQEDYPVPAGSYRVTAGDTLYKIGATTGFDWHDIASVNHIASPYTIFIGQVLLLPAFPYTVQGDTLDSIAAKVGENLTGADIKAYNHLTQPIYVGQVLQISRLQA